MAQHGMKCTIVAPLHESLVDVILGSIRLCNFNGKSQIDKLAGGVGTLQILTPLAAHL